MKPILLALTLLHSACLLGQAPVVTVSGGQIRGSQAAGGIQVFKGIPFAAPPVGDLRWKAPQAVIPWEGVRSCTDFGPSPVQGKPTPFMFWSEEFLIPEAPISEDCLYLNVWSGAATAEEKRPVLVYIYGGGFRSGGSGCPIYDGTAMAEQGVVFVSINYRVGVFGFLAHPELSQEAPYGSSGNYALLDMVAALNWVQDNIAVFGGDPDKVTIAGQSAGAFAVSFLTTSPLSQGLLHRAIAQSGGSFVESALRPHISLQEAEARGQAFAREALNCQSLAELRAKPAAEILQASGALIGPIIDGYVLPAGNASMYASGKHHDVPLILGWNGDDRVMFAAAPAATFTANIEAQYGDLADALLRQYPASTEAEATQSQYDLNWDQTFAIQMYSWAKQQDRHGQSEVYLYNFHRKLPAYTEETQFGAFHSGEIVYAYDNLHTLDRPWEPIDHQIADLMSAYWVNFAQTGNPNGTGLPTWEPFDPETEKALIFDTDTRMQAIPHLDKLHLLEQYHQR